MRYIHFFHSLLLKTDITSDKELYIFIVSTVAVSYKRQVFKLYGKKPMIYFKLTDINL